MDVQSGAREGTVEKQRFHHLYLPSVRNTVRSHSNSSHFIDIHFYLKAENRKKKKRNENVVEIVWTRGYRCYSAGISIYIGKLCTSHSPFVFRIIRIAEIWGWLF